MIPVGDSPRTSITPVVTWALILVNIVVWVWVIFLDDTFSGSRVQVAQQVRDQAARDCYGLQTAPTEREEAYCRWSLQPKEFFDNATDELEFPVRSRTEIWLSILTSMFMHAGWLHIGGNLLFLWVFGDNVEDRFGHLGFLLFYLASGIAASLTQAFIDPDSVIPVVGASGAIAGVLGAYLVFYPKATVNVVIPFFILIFIPLPIPAVIMIGLWFLQNLLAGFASVADETSVGGGVAFFAHIGGFVFGMLSVLLFFRGLGKKRRVRAAPRWPD